MVGVARSERTYDDRLMVQKICHLPRHLVVFAGVGDNVTRRVEREFETRLDDSRFDFLNIGRSLESLARDVLKECHIEAKNNGGWIENDVNRSMLCVFYGPDIQMWRVIITDRPIASPISGSCVGGAIGNLCRFYMDFYELNTPVEKLKTLAACTVLAANRFDSAMIGGLDVAVVDGSGLHLLTEDEKADLRRSYEELNTEIRRRLIGHQIR
jgi:hypothetical protein